VTFRLFNVVIVDAVVVVAVDIVVKREGRTEGCFVTSLRVHDNGAYLTKHVKMDQRQSLFKKLVKKINYKVET